MRRVFVVLALMLGTLALPGGPAQAAGETTITADAAATWQTNGVVWALAYANGVVYAGGTFTKIRPPGTAEGDPAELDRTNFAAFDASTGAPLPCAPSFTNSTDNATVRTMKASPDGSRLFVGGFFSSVSGAGVASLVAFDTASCDRVASFNPAVDATVRALDATDTTIYFGGDFNSVDGVDRAKAAAVDTSGALTAWDPQSNDNVRAIGAAPSVGRVFLGGDFQTLGGVTAHRLGATDATTGAVVQTYPGWIDNASVVKSIATDSQNFYVGAEGTGGGVFDGRIAAHLDGSLIWRDTCLGATQIVLPYNGVLYSGSHAHDCHNTPGGFPDPNPQGRQHLLGQSIADKTILPWFPDTNGGIGEMLGPRTMTVTADGTLWVGGEFTTVNNVDQQGLTRFPAAPDIGIPNAPVPTVSSLQTGNVLAKWRATWDRDDGVLTYRLYRDSTVVYTGTADSRFWIRPQLSFVDTVDPGSFHVYRLDVSDGDNTSPKGGTIGITAATTDAVYPNAVLGATPSLYWRLDESGPFVGDTSPNNSSGVSTGTIAYKQPGGITGDTNQSMTFNGGWVYGATQYTNPTTFSVEAWFNTTTTTGGKIIGFGNQQLTNSGSYDRHIYMANNGRVYFGEYIGSVRTIRSATAYRDGQWHHVVATGGPAGMHLYLDGVEVASNPNTNAQNYSGYWRVGRDNLSGWTDRPSSDQFEGSIDEVAVYPAQLTAAQVAAHYTAGH